MEYSNEDIMKALELMTEGLRKVSETQIKIAENMGKITNVVTMFVLSSTKE